MMQFRRNSTSLRTVIAGVILLSAGFGLQAQQLNILNNQATVNMGTPRTLNISASGIIDASSNIPTLASINIPSFSFNFESSGVTDGTYTFSAGYILQD